MQDMRVGIQLYTIREALKRDFKGVMRELVRLGCDGVEFASYFGDLAPDELAAFMREIGIRACGMHVNPADFDREEPEAFAYAKALDCPFVTFSMGGPFTAEQFAVLRERCAKAGAGARARGMRFTYHNHAAEFERLDGEVVLDRLWRLTDPAEVFAEPDVYWIAAGGADPVEYIRRYPARAPQIHMKDMDRERVDFTELGRGRIDLAGVVAAARGTVCEWLIYEQDRCDGDPFDSAVISLAHLRKLLAD